jgi:transcriptional regulator with XRE-family HTH domain
MFASVNQSRTNFMSEELFSYRVRRFREENGLNQEELATALGVTARYIGMIEHSQKDVEPSSSLYKLFCLLEEHKVPMPVDLVKGHKPDVRHHSDNGQHNSERPHYKANGTTLSVRDAFEQVRSDIDTLEKGSEAQRRRTFTFLKEVHLPILARALKIE